MLHREKNFLKKSGPSCGRHAVGLQIVRQGGHADDRAGVLAYHVSQAPGDEPPEGQADHDHRRQGQEGNFEDLALFHRGPPFCTASREGLPRPYTIFAGSTMRS